jgi:hypothetical protein
MSLTANPRKKLISLSDRWVNEALIVCQWYASLLTHSEKEAYKNLIIEGKASVAKSSKAAALLRTAKTKEKKVTDELNDGAEAFLKKTFIRVVTEHGDDLKRCPRCRLVCPPGAIVCEHCYLLLKK